MSRGQPVFYYDLGSVWSYLAAERMMAELPVAPEWEPIHGASLGLAEPDPVRAECERVALGRGLQPLRWPEPWPPDTATAMRVAAYAKQIGRAVAFSLAAFRQAFAGGRDLGDPNTILIAAAACEMHPTAVLKAFELRSVGDALQRAGERARSSGVRALPAIEVAGHVHEGEGAIEAATRVLEARV